jgi:hypothetical protein
VKTILTVMVESDGIVRLRGDLVWVGRCVPVCSGDCVVVVVVVGV